MNEAKSAKAFNLTTAILYTVSAGFFGMITLIFMFGLFFTGAYISSYRIFGAFGGAFVGAFLLIVLVLLAIVAAFLVPAIVGYSYNNKINKANYFGEYLEILCKQSKFLLIYSSVMQGLAGLIIIGDIISLIDGSEDDVASSMVSILFILVFSVLRLTFSAVANSKTTRLSQQCTPEQAQMRVNIPVSAQQPQMQYQQVHYAQPQMQYQQVQYTQPQAQQMQYTQPQTQYAQPQTQPAQYVQPQAQMSQQMPAQQAQVYYDPATGQPVQPQVQYQQMQYTQPAQYAQPQVQPAQCAQPQAQMSQPAPAQQVYFDPATGQPVQPESQEQ